ncbi:MAG: hypothetical protein JW987_11180 [Anaerolineaceae bacterium]|nr:hypothetical protein [Anaerolineaceae bacterium]
MKIKKTCPFCHSATESIWRGQLFLECRNCHLLIRNADLNKTDLDRLYRNSWAHPFSEIDETGGTTDRLARNYVAQLLSSLGQKHFEGKVVLDYGAGRGSMSFALQEAGAKVLAVEPYGYEFLSDHGIQTYKSIADMPLDQHLEGIVSLDVIEHLVEPWKDRKSISK